MNDGACDPQGRFWAGTLADDFRPGGGALYRLDHDGRVELMLDDLTISNGLGWSPDGATMYLVDSGPRLVHAFRFDQRTGGISRRSGSGRRDRTSRHSRWADGRRGRRRLGGHLRRRTSPSLFPRRCAPRGAALAGGADHLVRCSLAEISIDSTPRPRPRVGTTINVEPSRLRGSCTDSTQMPRAGQQRCFALSRPGGRR